MGFWIQETTLIPIADVNDMTERIILVCLIASSMTGCTRSAKVHFVLSNEYRGPFVIVVDHQRGVAPREKDGILSLEIPRSGVLRLKEDPDRLRSWHTLTAAYENGTPIPVDNGDQVIPSNRASLKVLFSSSNNTIWYFVGTAEERERALRMPHLKAGEVTEPLPPR